MPPGGWSCPAASSCSFLRGQDSWRGNAVRTQPWAGLSALRAPPCPRPSQAHPWSHARRPTARVRFPPSPRWPGLRDLGKLRRWATSCVDPGRGHYAHHPEGAREGGPRGVVSAAGRCPQPRPERPHAPDPRAPSNPASRVP